MRSHEARKGKEEKQIELCSVSLSFVKMSESLVVCEVDTDLVKKLREFRFRKETSNAAIIMKIDKDRQLVVLDEEYEVSACARARACVCMRVCGMQFLVYLWIFIHLDI
ncbi:hypothetical protein HF521_009622 [Silurus meridionalis]|uniref:ADF-H domain-containing protein n=1 Tax=Silurus meridionalis TaxID=175797 RepID=A0A8T0BYV1_SILME|nr:hypothetical protein HF521_009622 [Silurus meridionalis]